MTHGKHHIPHTLQDQIRELESLLHNRKRSLQTEAQVARLEQAIADSKHKIRRDKWHREQPPT